jgi:hypothetical protein
MPIEVMWSILIALGAITTAAVLKVVEYARKLHLSDTGLGSGLQGWGHFQGWGQVFHYHIPNAILSPWRVLYS